MEFRKDLSHLGWEEVKKRQLLRFPLVSEWIKISGMDKGQNILDIGSGPGVFTCEYAKVVGPNGRVVSIERSAEAIYLLELQKETEKLQNISIIEANAEEAISVAEMFHLIFLTDVLHHSDSPENILRNVASVATLETKILISEFDPKAKGEVGPPLKNRMALETIKEMVSDKFKVLTWGKQENEHYYLLLGSLEVNANLPSY